MYWTLADLQTVKKRLDSAKKSAKGAAAKGAEKSIALLERVYGHLQNGGAVRELEYSDEEKEEMRELHLLTMKPMIYVVNMDETGHASVPAEFGAGAARVEICAKLEAELADLSPAEAKEYLKSLGLAETGLDKLIKISYQLLNLVTFLTSGEPETRAWTVRAGAKAPEAAGVIHTDFIKGFIKADVVNWQDFVKYGGWSKIKETGKLRLEGKDYVVRDGDVIYFHINPVK
jgi:GTP-binding protein YchF